MPDRPEWEDWEQGRRQWRERQRAMLHQRWERRAAGQRWAKGRRNRWGLRRRLTFVFAFVALAAVFMTTWFILGAVYSALFAGSPGGNWWNWREHGWNDPQFAQARIIFGRVAGTAFWAATLSFLLALVVAGGVTWILTRPLIALTDGARRLEAGERGVRLRVPRSRDELRRLTDAFNSLAASLERQEAWRKGLVADIAHDLRTPLAVLRSEIEAMQDGVARLDEAGLERLHAQVLLLSKLVSDLRTLSLAESGGMVLKQETLALEPFLRGVVEAYRSRASEVGLELVLEPIPAQARATFDPQQLTRVLGNLLDNAVRYASPGTVQVGADPTKIWVRDHGPGIPPAALERVFERFYKVDSSRTRTQDSGGSGLGLSIARAIVEAHGGRLEAANHPEGGAVFTVWLAGG